MNRAKLNEIGSEAMRLDRDGQWSREAFERLLGEAKTAGGAGDELEFLYSLADHSWLKKSVKKCTNSTKVHRGSDRHVQ